MFTFYDKKYGVLELVPKPKGMKVKSGKVLMARKVKKGYVTESYDLESVSKRIPKTILKEYGWVDENTDLKDVFDSVQAKSFGNKTIIIAPNGFDIDDIAGDIDENTPLEQLKGLIKLASKGKIKKVKVLNR